MFQIVWIVLSTAILVPLGVAFLRGWTPSWSPSSDARVTRARGIAALTLYVGSLTPAILSLVGVPGDELLPLRIAGGPLLVLAAVALMMWASFADRRDKQS
ncbi:hypothetical protein [Streptomyces zaomyceticus]|uniref:hypothetical protein n=1 Tax=Streptomyces zaomyceticus TaxID=68286 RepID=UPI002E0FB8E3|nr:hypothetical protein OG237_36925 [Streptomyces zaomyceticus]